MISLILIVFGIMVACTIQGGKEDDFVPATKTEPESKPETEEKLKEAAATRKPTQDSYVGLYEYIPGGGRRKCACCDGENSETASVCAICGGNITG